jgi:hypothetical protein
VRKFRQFEVLDVDNVHPWSSGRILHRTPSEALPFFLPVWDGSYCFGTGGRDDVFDEAFGKRGVFGMEDGEAGRRDEEV